MLVVATILVGGGPWAIREAHSAGPVIQVVEINGYRTRFDNANPAFVRYLLIDPSNADPTRDDFAPNRSYSGLDAIYRGRRDFESHVDSTEHWIDQFSGPNPL